MKRVLSFWLAAIVTTFAMGTIAAAQSQGSLGDYARAVRKTKSPSSAKAAAKVYDNDNLPNSSSLSVVGQNPEPAADESKDQSKDAGAQAKGDKAGEKASGEKSSSDKSDAQAKAENPAQIKPGQAAEERQMAFDAWKAKLDKQKDKISLLSRELDVLKREHQLKASEFYANTALRVQNPSAFAAEDAKYKKQIADKQKELDEATAKLTEMQEEARKSGAPNSVTE